MKGDFKRWILAAAVCVLSYELDLPILVMAIGVYLAFKKD